MPALDLVTRRLFLGRSWRPPAVAAGPEPAPLQTVRRVGSGGHGPEDVQFDAEGRVVTGLANGDVVRIDPRTGDRILIADTGGRPLGVDVCADGSVLVADHDRGLLRVRDGGSVEVLVEAIDGKRIRFASNVAHAADGTIWFTTSTTKWDLDHYEGDFFEHSRTGRLVARHPDGTVEVLLDGLAFANGLVLAPGGEHLLYAETGEYRVSRYYLGTGATDALAEGLPGFPDNMSLGSDGLLWVGMPTLRDRALDLLLPLPGPLRTAVWNLPSFLHPKQEQLAWVIALDVETGEIVHDLRSREVGYGFVTAVAERDGVLAVSGLHERDVLVCRAPATVRRELPML